MTRVSRAICALCLLLLPALAFAKEVWLATIEPGELYWQRFGHNALIVRDGDQDISYNFGYFDFAQEDFLLRFMRGRMLYQAIALDADVDIDGYLQEGRRVWLQRLALSPAQVDALETHLKWHVAPENRDYRYDYYTSNCSTKIRDAIDLALAGALKSVNAHRSHGETYRRFTRAYAAPVPWLYLGTDLLLGQPVDKPLSLWEEMFIPGELKRRVREMSIDGAPLVAEEIVLPAGANPTDVWPEVRDQRPTFAAIGLMLAALIVLAARPARQAANAGPHASIYNRPRLLGLLQFSLALPMAIAGTVLALLWLATDHSSAWRNENLFLFSPIWWLALPGFIALSAGGKLTDKLQRLTRFAATLALISVALGAFVKVFRSFDQSNIEWLLLIWPVVLALTWSTRRGD